MKKILLFSTLILFFAASSFAAPQHHKQEKQHKHHKHHKHMTKHHKEHKMKN